MSFAEKIIQTKFQLPDGYRIFEIPPPKKHSDVLMFKLFTLKKNIS